jgi:hypothetical protein
MTIKFETNDIDKRIKRAGEQQSTHGKCVICGGAFQECPHSMAQANLAIMYYKMRSIR